MLTKLCGTIRLSQALAASLEEEVTKLASSNSPQNVVAAVNLMSALSRRAVVSRATKAEKIIDFSQLPSSQESEPYVEEEFLEYDKDDDEVEGLPKKPEGGGGSAGSHTGLSAALEGVAIDKK